MRASRWTPISSVASFFLSRIDTKADALPSPPMARRGQVALASARVAYQRYRAQVRRPRLRSGSVTAAPGGSGLYGADRNQDPAYSDVLYRS